jgi:homoserine dehydrogenase
LVPFEHPLAAVSNEFNALFIKGNAVGELMLYGKGAGARYRQAVLFLAM